MKNKKTLYHFVLDKSGSMSDVREQTIDMFNEQIQTIRTLQIEYPEQEFYVGLSVFNDWVTHLVMQKPVHLTYPIHEDVYRPSGLTALNDGIGESVANIQEQFGKLVENDEMSIVVVVLTDGRENASRKYDGMQIAQMITELSATEKWTFTVLGADFDISTISSSMKFSSSYNYKKSGFSGLSEDINESLRNYASSKSKGVIEKEFLKRKDQ